MRLLCFLGCMLTALLLLVVVSVNDIKPEDKLNKESALEICEQVKSILDSRGKSITCSYSPSKLINAHASIINGKYEVVIYQGMIDFVTSSDELAVVIGHELAHHMLGHTELPYILKKGTYNIRLGRFIDHQYFEAMSDLLGMQLATMSGYNACKGKDLWSRMVKIYGHNYYGNKTHPNTLARIYNFDTLCRVN